VTARPWESDLELGIALGQGMRLSPLPCLLLKPLHVRVEFLAVDTPYTPAAELDPGELSRANKRVRLGCAHVEVGSNVLKGEETRLDARRRVVALRRICHLSNATTRGPHLRDLPFGSGRLPSLAPRPERLEA
jgi:hypothetical protein